MKKKSVSKDQAIVIGQALVQGKWLECVSNSSGLSIFTEEYALYKPGLAAQFSQNDNSKSSLNDTEGPEWVNEFNELDIEPTDEEGAAQTGLPSVQSTPVLLSPLSLSDVSQSGSIKIGEAPNADDKVSFDLGTTFGSVDDKEPVICGSLPSVSNVKSLSELKSLSKFEKVKKFNENF